MGTAHIPLPSEKLPGERAAEQRRQQIAECPLQRLIGR